MSKSLKATVCAAALFCLSAAPALAADAASPSRVTVAQRVIDAASAYSDYVANAGAIKADFKDGQAVRAALITAATYQPEQLQSGEIAFAALTAMQDAKFVNSVRGYAAFPGAADRLNERLAANPETIFDLPEAQDAAIRVGSVLRAQGAQVYSAGKAVKQSAYDLQRADWSKAPISDVSARLTKIKTLSATPLKASPDDAARLISHLSSSTPADGGSSQITNTVARGLAIAALAVIGRGGEDNDFQLAALLSQPGDKLCLKMAKLNLFQCLAVAGPQYEDIFCLGEHGLKETASCVIASAGKPMENVATPRQVALASELPGTVAVAQAQPQAVFIPVASSGPAPQPAAMK
ncbi:MAG: hypothetical protein ACXW3D_04665 [Caulobacteraceae bacterium]